ncbi:MAG: guanylate kinase [Gammaproteobacteria bacterium]|nr:guanylate kinase [Gammaproteobacteria bacterium]
MNHRSAPKVEGRLFVFSSPSGGGKTMLVKRLLEDDPKLVVSVSSTTRPAREGEQPGIDYDFVSEEEFSSLVDSGEFLEHAEVFGSRYGTRRNLVEEQLRHGFDVLFDIDWQGARSIKRQFPNSTSFFIVPPSTDELRRRLVARGQDSEAVIAYRMSQARAEMSHYNEFDHVVVNTDADLAYRAIRDAIEAVRMSRPVQLECASHVVKRMLESTQ